VSRPDRSSQPNTPAGAIPALRSLALAWWLAVLLPVLLLAAAMYAAAFAMAPTGTLFSGFLLNSTDAWGYWAFARHFAQAGFLIDNPAAATPHPPAFFNLAWFSLGKAMALTGVSFLSVYYVFGVVAAGLMFWTIQRFARAFNGEGEAGRFAFLLAALGGGWGWIPRIVSTEAVARLRPLDLFHPEGFPLQSALFVPHFALSIALLAAILLCFRRGVSAGRRAWSWGAGMLTLLLGFFHPYHLVTVGLVAGAWIGVEQVVDLRRFHRGWIDLVALALGALPAGLYYRWLFRQPNWISWGTENEVLTGNPWGVAFGLGPLVLLAIAGARRRGRWRPDAGSRFLIVWCLVGLALLFSHRLFSFEAKLVEGLILPLSCLGARALFGRRDGSSLRHRIAAGALLFSLLPSSALLATESLIVAGGRYENFFPTDWVQGTLVARNEMAAMEYMSRNMSSADRVMVTVHKGRLIPALADVRLHVGGPHITPDYAMRLSVSERFYRHARTSEERRYLLRQMGITHVWYNQLMDTTLRPWEEPYLEPVFQAGEVSIWRVR
jgi:hypothetical protein